MKAKIIISSIIVLLALISLTAFKVRSQSQKEQIEQLQNAPDKGAIAWHARLAKAKGEREIVTPLMVRSRYPGVENLDEALSLYGAVVAQPIKKKSYITSTLESESYNEIRNRVKDDQIHTWYKFRILENLSGKPLSAYRACCDPDSDWGKLIPQEMLPVNEDEFMIEIDGGTVEIDGVKVTQNSGRTKFSESERYLLFLVTDVSGKVAGFGMGMDGVYTISRENTLVPISKRNERVIQDITGLYNSSLDSLKTYIWNHPSKK